VRVKGTTVCCTVFRFAYVHRSCNLRFELGGLSEAVRLDGAILVGMSIGRPVVHFCWDESV